MPASSTVINFTLHRKRHLSLDALARACGVSRAMLAQVESGRSVPSIKVLCKIAKGLKVSVAAFLEDRAFEGVEVLPAQQSKRLVSADGAFISRALFPYDTARQSEFYEIRLRALGEEVSKGHGPWHPGKPGGGPRCAGSQRQ